MRESIELIQTEDQLLVLPESPAVPEPPKPAALAHIQFRYPDEYVDDSTVELMRHLWMVLPAINMECEQLLEAKLVEEGIDHTAPALIDQLKNLGWLMPDFEVGKIPALDFRPSDLKKPPRGAPITGRDFLVVAKLPKLIRQHDQALHSQDVRSGINNYKYHKAATRLLWQISDRAQLMGFNATRVNDAKDHSRRHYYVWRVSK